MKFHFIAMDATGNEIKDIIEADDENHAQKKIREMGYFVTQISPKRESDPPVVHKVSKIKFEISIIWVFFFLGSVIGLIFGTIFGFMLSHA